MPVRSQTADGFTLIELLLVLVIVGVMATMATVSLSENPNKTLYREAKRLQMVLEFAADEAMMQGVELGLGLPKPKSYQIVMLDEENYSWKLMDDKTFKLFTVDSKVSLKVELPAELNDEELEQRLAQIQALGDTELQPAILLLSSGELTPFTISLTHGASDAIVTVSSDGFSGVIIH
jgi:general secretion pathway protein H